MDTKKQEKIDEVKAFIKNNGIDFIEKPNGQIIINKVNLWITTEKWYDPVNNFKGQGLGSFLSYAKKAGDKNE